MNRKVIILSMSSLLALSLIAVAVLSAIHADPTALIGLIVTGILPTGASLFAYNEASQAKANTNGILHKAASGELAVVKNAKVLPDESNGAQS